jgi:hypothetical protein
VLAQNFAHQCKVDIRYQHCSACHRTTALSNMHRRGQGTGMGTNRYTIRVRAQNETHYFFPELERFAFYHLLAPHVTGQTPYKQNQHRFTTAPISAADLLHRHNIKHLYTHWP